MNEKALEFLDYFEMSFDEGRAVVTLAEDAPPDLQELILAVIGDPGSEQLVCVYEALALIADSEPGTICQIDEKVCPLDLFANIMTSLEFLTM